MRSDIDLKLSASEVRRTPYAAERVSPSETLVTRAARACTAATRSRRPHMFHTGSPRPRTAAARSGYD